MYASVNSCEVWVSGSAQVEELASWWGACPVKVSQAGKVAADHHGTIAAPKKDGRE